MARHVVEVVIQGINRSVSAFKGLNTDLNAAITTSKFGATAIAASLGMASKKLFDFGKASVDAFSAFDFGVRRAAALSGEGEGAYEKLSAAAIKYGQATMFTGQEVGQALTEMSMAGLAVEETISALPAVLDMAAAGGIDLAEATGFAVNTMRAFQRDAKEMRSIVDIMSNTITSSALTMTELAEAMKMVSASANTLGISIPEITSAIGVLADVGIKGSMAGAGLRMAFIRLSKGLGIATDEAMGANAAFKKLGITAEDITFGEGVRKGQVDMVKMLELIKDKTDAMGRVEKLGFMATLFGARASNQMTQMVDNLEKYKSELLQSEAAAFKFAIQQSEIVKNIGGIDALRAAFQQNAGVLNDVVEEMGLGIEATNALRKSLSATGSEVENFNDAFAQANTSKQVIDEMNKSLEFLKRITKGVAATAKEQFGATLAPIFIAFNKIMTKVLEKWNTFAMTDAGKTVMKVVGALGALMASAAAITAVIVGFKLLLIVVGGAAAVIAVLFGKVLLIVAAIAAVGYILYKVWGLAVKGWEWMIGKFQNGIGIIKSLMRSATDDTTTFGKIVKGVFMAVALPVIAVGKAIGFIVNVVKNAIGFISDLWEMLKVIISKVPNALLPKSLENIKASYTTEAKFKSLDMPKAASPANIGGGGGTVVNEGEIKVELQVANINDSLDIRNVGEQLGAEIKKQRRLSYSG